MVAAGELRRIINHN